MKIVRIFGGLGNQMFQYALAVSIKKQLGEEVAIDHSVMRGYPLHNGYELKHIFNTSIPQASIAQIAYVAWPLPHYRLWQIGTHCLPKRKSTLKESKSMEFCPKVFMPNIDLMIEGYWQNERYFRNYRNEVLKAFAFKPFEGNSKNLSVVEAIKEKTSVSIHVRRGDYLKISFTEGICSLNYYKAAIDMIKRYVDPDMFVVFSDDIEWCRENLRESLCGTETVYVDWNKGKESYRDMQLMSLCSHNIIANSSFSWWGAWLNRNPEKKVIAPSRWMNALGWPEIIPDGWLTILV